MRGFIVLGALLAPNAAWALGTAYGPGKWKVDHSGIVVARDGDATTVTARFSVTTDGRPVLVAFEVPEATDPKSVRTLDDFAALDAATTPVFFEELATDPCAKDAATTRVAWTFPAEPAPLSAKTTVELVDGAAFTAATNQSAPPSARFLLWRVTPKKAERSRWTPAVQWRFAGDAPLALDRLDAWTPVGREHRVTLYTLTAATIGTPSVPVQPIGAAAPVAEVAFETPRDTAEAIVRHALRRADDGTFVRTFVGPVSVEGLGAPRAAIGARFEGLGTKRTPSAAVEAKAFIQPERAAWIIRRKWRAKSACWTPRVENGIRIEQTSELRAYAALTGRPVAGIRARSAERGYELGPKGLSPVKVKRAPGARREPE